MKKFHGFRGTEIILSNENRSLKRKIESLEKENRELLTKLKNRTCLLGVLCFIIFVMFVMKGI